MQLFYTPDISGDFCTLSVEESRHAVQVLRLRAGDTVNLIDGRGGLYTARIEEASPKACLVKVTDHSKEFEKRPYKIHMAVAPTKNIDRFEWFLEKATEMGLDRITPLLCDRSERKVVKTERSEKVVLSAAKQSLKAYVPQIDELTRFTEFIGQDFGTYKKYIAHCETGFEKSEFKEVISSNEDSLVLIGPEGDFSPEEIQKAYAAGFTGISLGSSRVRTEAAALMATAITAIKN